MIFCLARKITTTKAISFFIFTTIILISVSFGESKYRPFQTFRRKSSCYCPRNDVWHSKYSEDIKFSLISYEYRTHLKVLLDGSIVVEEGSPELLHGDNIWFTACDDKVVLKEGSHFEICLAGFPDKTLVFDKINGNFKIAMFPEQLTVEYHHMKVEAVVYFDNVDEKGNHFLHLTIRPKTNEINAGDMYMLWIDKTKRVENDYDPWRFQMKEVGRVSMVKIANNDWGDVDHVKLEMMYK